MFFLPMLTLIAIILLLSLPAWLLFKKRVNWYSWDYGVPFYGVALWIFLTSIGIGHQSLSHLVELLGVSAISILTPWIRVIFPQKNKTTSKRFSIIILLIPIIAAVLFRLFTPYLPE